MSDIAVYNFTILSSLSGNGMRRASRPKTGRHLEEFLSDVADEARPEGSITQIDGAVYDHGPFPPQTLRAHAFPTLRALDPGVLRIRPAPPPDARPMEENPP